MTLEGRPPCRPQKVGQDGARSSNSFEPPLVELNQIKIRPDVGAVFPPRFFEEMKEARAFFGNVGVARDHWLVPFLDFLRRMLGGVLLHPFQHFIVARKPVRGFLERVAVQLQKSEQMFVEADSFIVVSVEESLPVQARFVDQAREMNVAAQFLVRTTRMRFPDRRQLKSRGEPAPLRRWPEQSPRARARPPLFPAAIIQLA